MRYWLQDCFEANVMYFVMYYIWIYDTTHELVHAIAIRIQTSEKAIAKQSNRLRQQTQRVRKKSIQRETTCRYAHC